MWSSLVNAAGAALQISTINVATASSEQLRIYKSILHCITSKPMRLFRYTTNAI